MRQTRCSREIARNVEGNPQASSMITHEDFSSLGAIFSRACWEWCWDERKRGYGFFRNPLISLVGSTGLEPVAPAL